jgi:hypothetical protein
VVDVDRSRKREQALGNRYKALKVRERKEGLVERPLSNRTINKTSTRLREIRGAQRGRRR